MDIEFHYYMTFIIALRAGFTKEQAYKIAYSSQYTDDNDTSYRIRSGEGDYYINDISQTSDITKPQQERLRIYPLFHFMPGTADEIWRSAQGRKDGKLHQLTAIPASQNASALLRDALDSGNIYRIGIASHMFADTFAHQNFVGFKDEFNAMSGFLEGLLPNIGHADAKFSPDIPNLIWKDTRLTSKFALRKNRDIFLSAAASLFDHYDRVANRPAGPAKEGLLADVGEAIGAETESGTNKSTSRRLDGYKDLLKESLVEYNEDDWFDEAVRYGPDPQKTGTSESEPLFFCKTDFKESDWYLFQEAVKEHQKRAFALLRPSFENMEIAMLGNW